MRSILIISTVALALPVFSAPPKPDVEKAVLAAQKAYVDGLVKSDKAILEKILGEELTYTHSSAKTETKADVLQVISSGSAKYVSVDFQDVKLRQYGNVVVSTQKAAFTTKQSGTTKIYMTIVWAKEKGGWQMVSRQATKLP
ncbi:MAG: nuclear transport factor 2 family protein [Bryobacteraceae bacterium]